MPWKPQRPCNHPSCPNLSDQSYCEQHRKKAAATSNREYDSSRRDQEMRSFYTSVAWRRLRDLKLIQNPICEECFKRGRIRKAVVADHILPAKEYPGKRLDFNNLQSLCSACHNRKHGQDKLH